MTNKSNHIFYISNEYFPKYKEKTLSPFQEKSFVHINCRNFLFIKIFFHILIWNHFFFKNISSGFR